MIGAPILLFVRQHGEAGQRPVVAVMQAIVIGEHPFGKIRVDLTLHFNVDQHPHFFAACAPDLDQLVGQTSAQFGIAYDLLQFPLAFVIPMAKIGQTLMPIHQHRRRLHEFKEKLG